ncbi:hypothetical protein ACLOJK_021379 [Asimina triloba]
MAHIILFFTLFALSCTLALASPLQDFCVFDRNSPVLVNGLACKDPEVVQAEDFYFGGFDKPGNTSNFLGNSLITVLADKIPGLNKLGIGLARRDFAPGGVAQPHYHPRATEVLTVLKGSIYAGFVTTNPQNRLFSKILHKGDVFVFPLGLIHFQRNVGRGIAITISALSNENPGVIVVPNSIFGSNGTIPIELLTTAFQLDKKVVEELQSKFTI